MFLIKFSKLFIHTETVVDWHWWWSQGRYSRATSRRCSCSWVGSASRLDRRRAGNTTKPRCTFLRCIICLHGNRSCCKTNDWWIIVFSLRSLVRYSTAFLSVLVDVVPGSWSLPVSWCSYFCLTLWTCLFVGLPACVWPLPVFWLRFWITLKINCIWILKLCVSEQFVTICAYQKDIVFVD